MLMCGVRGADERLEWTFQEVPSDVGRAARHRSHAGPAGGSHRAVPRAARAEKVWCHNLERERERARTVEPSKPVVFVLPFSSFSALIAKYQTLHALRQRYSDGEVGDDADGMALESTTQT